MPFTFLALLALFAPAWSQQVTHLTYNLSNPRIHAGASAWGATSIAIAGGKTATGWSSDIDVFDTEAKKWTTGHLPVARADQGGPAEGPLPGGKAFFGGQIAPDSEGTVVVMDSTTGQEVSTAKLGTPRSILSCTSSTSHGVIVCAGGQGQSKEGTASQDTDVIHLNPDGSVASIDSTGKLKIGRKKLSGAASGDLIAFGMGYSDLPGPNNGYSDAVDIYNVSSKAWSDTRLPSSTEYHRKDGKRMYGTAVGCGGFIIFAGGQIGGGRSAAVDVLDAATGQWAPSIGNLTVARSALAAACAGDRFALFGGGQIPLRDTVDVLDTVTMKWLPAGTIKLNTPRSALAAAGVGGCAVFAGGLKVPEGAFDTDVFCFE